MANPGEMVLTRAEKIQRNAHQPESQAPLSGSVHATASLKAVPSERSILVVEADPDLQVQTARALRGPGLRVVAAGSAGGALALLQALSVDLVLVSETLPGRSGIDLVREIRGVVHANCPVVVMTAEAPSKLAVAAAKTAGAAGCVKQPRSVENVAAWLVRGNDVRGNDVRPGDVRRSERRLPLRARRARAEQASSLQRANSVLPVSEAVAE